MDAQVQLARLTPVIEATDTLEAAIERWEPIAFAGLKPSTISSRRHLIRKRLVEPLGHLPLRDIDERVVLAWQNGLLDVGLAPATVQKTRQMLVAVLDEAVRRGELRRNKARAVAPPPDRHVEAVWFTSDEVSAILDAAAGDRSEAVLSFIAATGVRKGEALALKWSDVDGAKATIRGTLARVDGELIVQEPKTQQSRRTVDLVDAALDALHLAREQQQRDQAASPAWRDLDYVFTTESGEAIDPRNILRSFTRIRKAAGISRGNIHSLRHGLATHLLMNGTPVEVVSKHLGHARTSITLDTYSHATEEDRSEAIQAGLVGYGKRRRGSGTDNVVSIRRMS